MVIDKKVDPRSIYHLMVHNFCWMDPLNKNHMISDLFTEFLTFLDPNVQLAIVRQFPLLDHWEKMVDKNSFLSSVRLNNLDKKCKYDSSAYEAWKEGKARALNVHWNLTTAEAKELSNGRLLFGTMRHSYSHLPEHGLKVYSVLNPNLFMY